MWLKNAKTHWCPIIFLWKKLNFYFFEIPIFRCCCHERLNGFLRKPLGFRQRIPSLGLSKTAEPIGWSTHRKWGVLQRVLNGRLVQGIRSIWKCVKARPHQKCVGVRVFFRGGVISKTGTRHVCICGNAHPVWPQQKNKPGAKPSHRVWSPQTRTPTRSVWPGLNCTAQDEGIATIDYLKEVLGCNQSYGWVQFIKRPTHNLLVMNAKRQQNTTKHRP